MLTGIPDRVGGSVSSLSFLVTWVLSCGLAKVDCRAECETYSETVVGILTGDGAGDPSNLEYAFVEGCQDLSEEASCEDCNYEITAYLIDDWYIIPDSACYHSESRDEVSWNPSGGEPSEEWVEECEAISDYHGGTRGLKKECTTCETQ